jgi:hypothetical protein
MEIVLNLPSVSALNVWLGGGKITRLKLNLGLDIKHVMDFVDWQASMNEREREEWWADLIACIVVGLILLAWLWSPLPPVL